MSHTPTGPPTADDLKQDMPARTWGYLEGDLNAGDALRKSEMWVMSMFRRHGIAEENTDWTDEVVIEAALERAKYELYKLHGAEAAGTDHRLDAKALLAGYFSDDEQTGEPASSPAAAVVAASKPAWMQRFEGRVPVLS